VKTETLEMVLAEGGSLVDPSKEAPAFMFEDDGTEMVAPIWPTLKIVQGVSKMDSAIRHIGEFWRSDTGDFYPEIEIVPLLQRPFRAMFVKGSEDVQCASTDGVIPLPGGRYWEEHAEPAPDLCDECVFSKWGKDNNGKWLRPDCGAGWNLLAVHDGTLVRFRIGGSNVRTWEEFVGARLVPSSKKLCQVRLTLASEERTAGTNKWMGLVIKADEDLPPEEVAEYAELVRFARESYQARAHDVAD
jgi:hypothetical protein